jgi:hypothetical protein
MRALRLFALGAAIGSGLATPASAAPQADCATSLKAFVADIDSVLAKNPDDILDIYAVIDRHLPVRGCAADEASRIVHTSAYFQGDAMNAAKIREFSLGTASQSANGVAVRFGLTATGESNLPHALWWPPRFAEDDRPDVSDLSAGERSATAEATSEASRYSAAR